MNYRIAIMPGLFALLVFFVGLMHSHPAQGITSSTFTLITHNDNAENLSLKYKTLRSIYSMQKQSWPNGERLTVFVFPDNESLHKEFCIQVLQVLPYQLRRGWDRLIFTGKAGAPIMVNSIEEMKARVASTPGAIGYITQEQVDESISVVEIKQ